jgi:hypothetical protein
MLIHLFICDILEAVKDPCLLLMLIIHFSTKDMRDLDKALKNLALQPKNFERRRSEAHPIKDKKGKVSKRMNAIKRHQRR